MTVGRQLDLKLLDLGELESALQVLHFGLLEGHIALQLLYTLPKVRVLLEKLLVFEL